MDFLKSIAPWLAAAATGGIPALVGMAANELTSVLGYDVPTEKSAIEKAVSGATAEQLLAIKQADQTFAVKMQELGYGHIEKLEALAVDDRKSAREREMSVRDWTPKLLAAIVTVGYFGVLGYMLHKGVPEHGGDALLVMLGALGGGWSTILAYYYGSSSSSAAKNELLMKKNPN
jgi:hypothetical protein